MPILTMSTEIPQSTQPADGGNRFIKMLADDARFAGDLAECDNRKLLWLAMSTKAWMNLEVLGADAAILAEVESRLYPEYDGDKVKFTEWGWDVCGEEVRYVPSEKMLPSAQPAAEQAGSGECEYCGSEGVVDSGGFTPWGEGINVPCGACKPPEPSPAPQQTAREWGESAIDDLLNQACTIPQIAIDYLRQSSNRCAQAEGKLATLQAERDQLRAWKESALAVESEWDEQKIAEMLGAAPGQSCRKIITEKVPALIAERDTLRAALDAAITFIKELNATTNQHGRQYRSRCGQFLATFNQTLNNK